MIEKANSLLKLDSIANVSLQSRPSWAKDGVMSASVFKEDGRYWVIGRGYEHAGHGAVARSQLFKAAVVRADLFGINKRPFIKILGEEVEVSDPTVVQNPSWYKNKTVVLYSVGTRLGENVTTDILLSPLTNPAKRTLLVDATKLKWFGRAIDKVKEPEVLGNRFFYEFGDGKTSRIAAAEIKKDGKVSGHRLFLDVRIGSWDCDHVSTGPMIKLGKDQALMIYNGARQGVWSIGLLVFDSKTLRIISRGSRPLIKPTEARGPHNQRIAFASSAVIERDKILLYYHEADRSIKVATFRRDF